MIIKQPAITLFLLDKYPYLVYQILRKNEERVISPMVLQMAELVQKKQTGIINSISTTVWEISDRKKSIYLIRNC